MYAFDSYISEERLLLETRVQHIEIAIYMIVFLYLIDAIAVGPKALRVFTDTVVRLV